MITGCTGIALYCTESITPIETYEIGLSFFESIDVKVNDASYYKLLENGDHKGDHDIFEASPNQLKKMIAENEVSSFWIYHNLKKQVPWHVAFSRQTQEFSGFYYLMAICDFPIEETYEPLTKWLMRLANRYPQFPYGILYTSDKITNAIYYAAGNNAARMFPYEDVFAFKKETPGLYDGKGRYSGEMLRMVYPCNLINRRHLQIEIEGMELKDWIMNSKDCGTLTELGQDLWMWEVGMEHLERVNQACGEAGFLVTWKPQHPKKPRRKLP